MFYNEYPHRWIGNELQHERADVEFIIITFYLVNVNSLSDVTVSDSFKKDRSKSLCRRIIHFYNYDMAGVSCA